MPNWFIIFPAILMLIFPAWAMFYQVFIQGFGMEQSWINEGRWLLVALGIATLAIEIWMIVEACLTWGKAKGADYDQTPLDNPIPEGADKCC